ncbi:hypothetical protein N7467_010681 [Penicillium canescens]|nr:hypothetical protein N7467_010681 [Penicillium canescens]
MLPLRMGQHADLVRCIEWLGWKVLKPDSFKSWLTDSAARCYGETSMQVGVAKEFDKRVCSFYEQYGRLRKGCDCIEHGTLARMRDFGLQVDASIDTLVVLYRKDNLRGSNGCGRREKAGGIC